MIRPTLSLALAALALLLAGGPTDALAQPSDAQVLEDMTGPDTISIELTPSNGQKQWNADYGVWEYVRGVVAVRDYPEMEGVSIRIRGDAVYQMYGGTDYKYWKFRVMANEYLGMDAPSSEELMTIVQSDLPKFLSTYWYNRIIGDVKALYIADDPAFVWHTPNSLSFNVVAEYTARTSDIHLEDIVQIYNVRLYREGEDQPWHNFLSSRGERQTSNKRELPREEIREMKTLATIDGERQAAAALATAPAVDLSSPEVIAIALNRELRNGTPESVEAFLVQTLAPMYFADGSDVLLNAGGVRVVQSTVQAAFHGRSPYRIQFCDEPTIDEGRSSSKRIYLEGIGGRAKMQVAFVEAPGGYVNGVKQPGSWRISSIGVHLAQKDDDIAFFESFTDPSAACPGDG
jgi:hypothetical protein